MLTVAVMCVVGTARCNVEVQSWSGDSKPGCNVQPGYVKLNGYPKLDKPSCDAGSTLGLYLVRVDPLLCIDEETKHFDTKNNRHLRDYLENKVDKYKVVAGVSIEDARGELADDAVNALIAVLGVDITNIGYRGSVAFVAQKSTNNKLVSKETAQKSSKNPAHVNVKISGMSTKIRY